MRYKGGMLGGVWLTSLLCDLGNGKFDGANLVWNFESLNPANTLWSKNYRVYSEIDTEEERFLNFEKWWGGFYLMNAEEIHFIVSNLFVGNKLEQGKLELHEGEPLSLKNIQSPIVVFASKGDNITPPQQALGWIVDLYEEEEDLLACGQAIIYAVHENIGHLGIFVSGGVARKEHEEFAGNIDLIDILTPGIYEAVITAKSPDDANPDLAPGNWITRFERRTLDDIRAIVRPDIENEHRFAAMRRVSEANLGLYSTFLRPWVRAVANEPAAFWMHRLNPAELPYEIFSDNNPFMEPVARLAEHVRAYRRPASPDNPFLAVQAAFSDVMVALLDGWRDLRDWSAEAVFLAVYSSPLLQALAGLRAHPDESPRRRPGIEPERIAFVKGRIAELTANIAKGDLRTAVFRSLIYIAAAGTGVDKRHFEALRRIRAEYGGMTLAEFKRAIREQMFSLVLNGKAALDAIPGMLPDDADKRVKALAAIRRLVSAASEPTGAVAKRLARIEQMFGAAAPAGRVNAKEDKGK